MFLKECKCIDKNVVRQIIDDSDESQEKQIKAIRLIYLEKAILKMLF